MNTQLLDGPDNWLGFIIFLTQHLSSTEIEQVLGVEFSVEEELSLRDFSPLTVKYLDAIAKKATIKPVSYPCVLAHSYWEGIDAKEILIQFYYAHAS